MRWLCGHCGRKRVKPGPFPVHRIQSARPFCLLPFAFFLCLPFFLGCSGVAADDRVRQINDDGVFLYQRGEYAGAREDFEFALTLKPGDPGLTYNVGQCYEHQGNAKKAEESYKLCLNKDPNHLQGQSALIKLLVNQGRTSEAKDVVQTWLVSQPKLADAFAHDGWLFQQQGDVQSAMGRLQQALELDPHNVHALVHLAMLFESLERPDRALVLYEEALQREPNRDDLRRHVDELIAKGVKRPLPDG